MTQSLLHPTPSEQRLAALLRERAVAEIERRGNLAAVAEALRLAPSGVEALLWVSDWTLQQAFRVADALGLIDAGAPDRLLAAD